MPRIMIFDATPDDSRQALTAFAGAESNEAMFTAAIAAFEPESEMFAVNVADGEALPQGMQITDFDGVLITGSPLNVYHDTPPVRRQIELAREIYHLGVPSFGSCWGLQLMSAALGGAVHLNPRGREFGVARNIAVTDEGGEHPLYRGKPMAFEALCSHEDEVLALPNIGRRLAGNEKSAIQAAEIADGDKSFWGVQYHPEFTFGVLAALTQLRRRTLLAEGMARNDAEVDEIADDLRALHADAGRHDLAWRYGLTENVLDPVRRRIEFRNWLETKVLPRAAARS